jgi:PST family polysaccharide transporter
VLFLIGPVLTVQAFSAAYLQAIGEPGVVLRFRFISTLANVVGFLIAVWFGILAVAAAFVLRGYLLLPLNLAWMSRYGHIPTGEYLRQLRGIAIATAAMAAAVLAVKLLLAPMDLRGVLMTAEILAGGATYLVVIWVVERGLVRDITDVLAQVVRRRQRDEPRVPGPVLDEEI